MAKEKQPERRPRQRGETPTTTPTILHGTYSRVVLRRLMAQNPNFLQQTANGGEAGDGVNGKDTAVKIATSLNIDVAFDGTLTQRDVELLQRIDPLTLDEIQHEPDIRHRLEFVKNLPGSLSAKRHLKWRVTVDQTGIASAPDQPASSPHMEAVDDTSSLMEVCHLTKLDLYLWVNTVSVWSLQARQWRNYAHLFYLALLILFYFLMSYFCQPELHFAFETHKSKLALNPTRNLTGFQKWKYRQNLAWRKMKLEMRDLTSRLELWGHSFKTIEGHFGSGVMSYFKFLKWMFLLNIYIFLLMFCFVVVPQIIVDYSDVEGEIIGNISASLLNQTAYCSSLYVVDVDTSDVLQLIIDFIQGTGWMEKTYMFYGYYTDTGLNLDELFADTDISYNMPFAYLVVTLAYFAFSLAMQCSQTSETFTQRMVHESDTKSRGYLSTTFSGWDFTIEHGDPALVRHKSIYLEYMGCLDEVKQALRRAKMGFIRKFVLFLIRLLINLFILGMLCLSAYVIYVVTIVSTSFSTSADYDRASSALQLFYDYLPSVTITALNFIVPLIFTNLVRFEDYTPPVEIRLTLVRTVFLKLASLAVLFWTLYNVVTCGDRDQCGLGINDCPVIVCWETYVGQQIYRLVITFIATQFGVVLFVEFPRKLLYTHAPWKLIKLIGLPQFNIPKNVLDLVYAQALFWIGTFFAPLLTVMSVILFFLLFYFKKMTVLRNYAPAQRPYRSSKSHEFFMIVLLCTFVLCCIPVGYVVYTVTPSRTCGPFRLYNEMWQVIPATINRWPSFLPALFGFITSSTFILALLVILVLFAYMFSSLSSAKNKMIRLLREQVKLSSRDQAFLLNKLNEMGADVKKNHRRQSSLTTLVTSGYQSTGSTPHAGNAQNGSAGHPPPDGNSTNP